MVTAAPSFDPTVVTPIAGVEGSLVKGVGGSWIAHVLGVHADDRYWWIQIASADNASASVVVRCSHHARAEHVIAALRGWHPRVSITLQIRTVMV
jgi:hypothetical protein